MRRRFAILIGITVASAAFAQPWPGKIELPAFPKTDPIKAFANLKIFDTNGSPIRVPRENWELARQTVSTNTDWQQWVAKRRKLVDDWMAKRHDRPDWIAGWAHNFVSPKDSSFLTYTPDEPGEFTLSSPSDPRVQLTPKLHEAWVGRFRMQHAEMMIEAARLFRLTGDTNYAQWTKSQLNFYAKNLYGWKLHNKARVMFQSLDDAVILIKWVTAARTLDACVSAKEKKYWSKNLFLPEAAMLEDNFQVTHNIACWHRSAEAQVALYCDDKTLWSAAVDGPNGIRNEIARGVTSDFLWFEQSMGYNAYVTRALRPFFEYALISGRGDDLKTEMATIENLLLSPLSLRFPNGQLPNPSDAGKPAFVDGALVRSETKDNEPPALAAAVRLFPTKIGLQIAKTRSGKSWEMLFDPISLDAPPVELPPVTSRNLESSRMAIIRNGPWQVYFHYGQLAGTHAQAEALNFEAFYNDIAITDDPGTAGYGSKLTAEYFRAGIAHNVPLVDGGGQKAGWGAGSWNPGVLDSFADIKVSASQPHYRGDALAMRTLAIDSDKLRDEVRLATVDGKFHALGFVLNLKGKAQLPDGFAPDKNFADRFKSDAFQHLENITTLSAKDKVSVDVDFSGMRMRIEFELPGAFKISHATAPDYPPNRRETFYLETHGTNATLKTTIYKL